MPGLVLAKIRQLLNQCNPLRTTSCPRALRQRFPSRDPDDPPHERLGSLLGLARGFDCHGPRRRPRPPRLPRQRRLVDRDSCDQRRVLLSGRQCDVAAIAVADDHRATASNHTDEICYLRSHIERAAVRNRLAVSAAVVPSDEEVLVQSTTEPQHSCRPIHRTMYEHDQRMRRVTGLLGPHWGHETRTMRKTSVLAPLGRSGAPASTNTVSPAAM